MLLAKIFRSEIENAANPALLVNLESEMYFWVQIVAENELKLSLSRFINRQEL